MMRSLTKIIDKIVVKQAEVSSLLMVVLVVMMCYEVTRRYFSTKIATY